MRKLLPWALLGVLGVGVAVAAVVGQVQSPAASSTNWLANLLATTAAAGSAHLRISSVTLSADPVERSSSVATGVIDFTTGNFRFNQLNHEVSFASTNGGPPQPVPYNWGETEIAIGQSLYEKDFVTVSDTSSSLLPTTWNKFINPRYVHQAFGLDAGTSARTRCPACRASCRSPRSAPWVRRRSTAIARRVTWSRTEHPNCVAQGCSP